MTHELQPTVRKDGSPTLPARGYSRPPFEDDNTAALVHGASSPRVHEAVAVILADAVVAEAPWLEAAIFQDAVWRYARAEARARLLNNYIFAIAEEHPEKVGVRVWEAASASDRTASKLAETLGLTPLSRAKLQQIVTGTASTEAALKQLADKGGAALNKRKAELQLVKDQQDDERRQ
jgi:hypothetical protein